ncbi:hypothetical protein [Spiroplasma eriocheiris]|uniref:Transmembrane protein n=1 Tax=Spiroplasma eriocheiris TaxID=315358 RepID=A0A0H3XIF2_9MOLU|nr:hypothetical protein [Spiroplasma eriocheiris]AHF58228.1 hypothetical protein SPE_1114 [Spiroplasma eriocheiris CCTCC M 207170]AKM54663.1 hypothetical protein SERIO_v1c11100 [Spiroplasma eriocheiris]
MRSETYYKKVICAIIFFALFSISTFAVFAAAIGYIIDNTMINPNLPAEEKDKLFVLLYQPVQAKVAFIFIIPAILGLIIIFRSFKLWAKLNQNGEPSPNDLKWLFSFTIVLGFYSFFILFTSLINHQTDMAGATAIIPSGASNSEILAKPGFNFLEWTTKLEVYDILLWICLGTYLILLVPISIELATLKKLPNVPKEPTLATPEEVNLASDNSHQPTKFQTRN